MGGCLGLGNYKRVPEGMRNEEDAETREVAHNLRNGGPSPPGKCMNTFTRLCTYFEAHPGPLGSKNLDCILRMAESNFSRLREEKYN